MKEIICCEILHFGDFGRSGVSIIEITMVAYCVQHYLGSIGDKSVEVDVILGEKKRNMSRS